MSYTVLTYQIDLCTFAYILSCALCLTTPVPCSLSRLSPVATTLWTKLKQLKGISLCLVHGLLSCDCDCGTALLSLTLYLTLWCCATWSNLNVQVLNVQPLPLRRGLSCALVYAFPMLRSDFVILNVNH